MQDVALRGGHWLGGLSSGAAQVSPLLPQALTGFVIMEGPEISSVIPSPSGLKWDRWFWSQWQQWSALGDLGARHQLGAIPVLALQRTGGAGIPLSEYRVTSGFMRDRSSRDRVLCMSLGKSGGEAES